jgi:hypothetical protein
LWKNDMQFILNNNTNISRYKFHQSNMFKKWTKILYIATFILHKCKDYHAYQYAFENTFGDTFTFVAQDAFDTCLLHFKLSTIPSQTMKHVSRIMCI